MFNFSAGYKRIFATVAMLKMEDIDVDGEIFAFLFERDPFDHVFK